MVELLPLAPTPPRSQSLARSWAALYGSIALDTGQVFALDYSEGFTNLVLVAAAAAGFLVQLYLFAIALRRIAPAVANGLFGLGSVAVALISIGLLGEPITPLKALALLAVIAGAVLLNTAQHDEPARTAERTGERP